MRFPLGYFDTAQLIVKKGANVNAVSKENKTALIYALESGNISNLFNWRSIIQTSCKIMKPTILIWRRL